jgi:hypothetical protein
MSDLNQEGRARLRTQADVADPSRIYEFTL